MSLNKRWYASALGLLFLFATNVQAVTFVADIEESDWHVEGSKFFCRLQQTIPAFGSGQFFHEAGEKVRFELKPTQSDAASGTVRLVSEPAPWQPGTAPEIIGHLTVPQGIAEVQVPESLASKMLLALYQGRFPTFVISTWLDTGEPARVALSAANYQKAYKEYVACVDGLLPVNYRQIARTAVLFPPAQWRLSDATKKRLDLIAVYIKTDDSVSSVYVDGHSDSAGRRLQNRDLSKQRAEEVTRYLEEKGIGKEMITTRYHGERYPVVRNNSAQNRARNRRVTIRLERGE